MSERIRVRFAALSASRAGGGITFAMAGLAAGLTRRGHCVGIAAFRDGDSERDMPLWSGVESCLASRLPPMDLPYKPGLDRLFSDKPDVIHLHGLWTQFTPATMKAAARHSIPRVVSPHGMLEEWALGQSRLKKMVALRLFERDSMESACVHALTDTEVAQVRRLGVSAPICVIPNGIDFQPERERRALKPDYVPGDSVMLLFLGRIHPKKGLSTFLSALHSVVKGSRNVHLVVGGPDEGGHRAQLEALASRLGIGDNVHFPGPLFGDDKRRALESCDAFVLPSLSEGLPMAVLEAWSCGAPVLMTRECNLSAAFAAEAALELPHDDVGMKAALERFLQLSRDERASLGTRGREYARTHYSWEEVAQRFEQVYRWLRGNAPQPGFVLAAGAQPRAS